MSVLFVSSLFFALCSLLFFQAVDQKKILQELKTLRNELNELKPKETLHASSQKLSQIWKKRSAFTKRQNAKQFISTLLDEYEQLSSRAYSRKPDKDGFIEDRDLLFP